MILQALYLLDMSPSMIFLFPRGLEHMKAHFMFKVILKNALQKCLMTKKHWHNCFTCDGDFFEGGSINAQNKDNFSNKQNNFLIKPCIPVQYILYLA